MSVNDFRNLSQSLWRDVKSTFIPIRSNPHVRRQWFISLSFLLPHNSPSCHSHTDSVYLPISMFTFLPPPSLPPSRTGLLCGGSLVPLGGHYWSPEECFRPQAEAMHSGVASPSPPDLEKLGAARSGTAKKKKCPQLKPSCLASVCISSTRFPHASLFWSTFLVVFIRPLGGLVPFHVCFDANRTEGEGHTVSPCPWHSRLFGCLARIPPLNSGGPKGAGSVPWVRLAFAKGQLLLWPNRWHFLTVKIRLQRSQVAFTRVIAESWGFKRKHTALKSTVRWKDEDVF